MKAEFELGVIVVACAFESVYVLVFAVGFAFALVFVFVPDYDSALVKEVEEVAGIEDDALVEGVVGVVSFEPLDAALVSLYVLAVESVEEAGVTEYPWGAALT